MATQALSSDSTRRIMNQIRQYEATSGKKLSKAEIDSLFRQELEVSANRSAQSRALEIQKENLDRQAKFQEEQLAMQREQADKAASAAKTSGYTQLAGTALTAGVLLKDTGIGKTVSSGVGKAVDAVSNVFTGGTTPAAGVTAASSATGTAVPTAQAAATGATSEVASTASSAAGSAVSSVVGAAGVAGVGRLGAQLLGGGSTTEDVATIGSATLYGFAVGGPVGAVVGAAVGVAYDFIADTLDTIICVELHRQHLLPKRIMVLAREYRIRFIPEETYKGYLVLAEPIVKKMQRSQRFTKFIAPIAIKWAYEMASRVDGRIKGNAWGKVINIIGQPICKLTWRIKEWRMSLKTSAEQAR